MCQPVSMEASAGKPLLPLLGELDPEDPTYPQPAPLPTPTAWCKACETQKPGFSAAQNPFALVSRPEVRIKVSEAPRGLPTPPRLCGSTGSGQFSVGVPSLQPHARCWVHRHEACSQVQIPSSWDTGHWMGAHVLQPGLTLA